MDLYEKNGNNLISQWMMFLDNPNSKEVEKIMDKNEDIKKAKEEFFRQCNATFL